MKSIPELIKEGEGGNVEFKEFLSRGFHLKRKERRESLASQMKYRLNLGSGTAVYILGVQDNGTPVGLIRERLEESLEVIEEIARGVGLSIKETEVVKNNGRLICRVTISRERLDKNHLLIATAGHVDHGKSTLIGTLISGILDNGNGKTRAFLDTLKHEIERGLSADLSYAVYGFTSSGRVIYLSNPLNKKSRADVVARAKKLVSFVDTVGHEPWLRTTIRGIVGQKLDYGLLVIAADGGITSITKEHLGILIAMDIPVIIAITKADRVRDIYALEREIDELLSLVGRVRKRIRDERDIRQLCSLSNLSVLVPVVFTSAKTGLGMELLHRLFYSLPERPGLDFNAEFMMYIDKVYNVSGVGLVVSGSVKQGNLKVGDILYLGPDYSGTFHEVRVASIELHYYSVESAQVGEIVGVALKGYKGEVRRGMVLTYKKNLKAVKSFEANVAILNHPTRIAEGYEPIIHLETISETVTIEPLEKDFLAAGDRGRVRMSFKYSSYYIEEGMKFIFREGRSKGIGVVTRVNSSITTH
ncbi:selenocysteine-specific elongation factor [archaeon]|nr:selenocysteine-specific elongation factor [archaeon]